MGGKDRLKDNPRVFLSYARKDGEEYAKRLRNRLECEHPEVTLWRDRTNLEGGVGWWKQITEALDKVKFLVLVMTPGALESFAATCKEWQYARQQGVKVYPVKAAPDHVLDFSIMPQWMRKAQFFDLDHEWETFINCLKSSPERIRVPFMAPDLPKTFIERPEEFGELLKHILSPDRQNPIPISTALLGAGGFGKTTLASALCHNDDVITAFDDGILWVTLGERPGVRDALAKLHNALTGETAVFNDIEEAAYSFSEKIADRNCLIVVDDVWNAAHLRPFLRGGNGCARLVTTRNLDVVLEAAAEPRPVNVNEMKVSEAIQMLIAHLNPQPADLRLFAAVAQRVGKWPLLLGFINAALRERIKVRHDSVAGALRHINQTLDRRGLTAFDHKDPVERNDAVNKSIEVSLELLNADQRRRYHETGIFPEDTDVPLTTLSALWGFDDFDTQELAELFDDFSLLKLNLETGTVRLHDVLRAYLTAQLPDPLTVHEQLLKAWDSALPHLDPYAWRHVAYHLVAAGRTADLRRLLLNFAWLQAKLDATDHNALIADYDYFPDDFYLRLVQSAIRLSSHIGDKSQLASQLHGRLLGQPSSEIQHLLANAYARTPWLRPLTPSLMPPGGPLLRTLLGHSSEVNAVAVTADGCHVVSASNDKTVKVWDLQSGQLLRTLVGHSSWVTAVAVTADGCHVVSGSSDNTLKVWDLESGQLLRTLVGHSSKVASVAVVVGECHVISASADRTLKVWDLHSGQLLRTIEGHASSINGVAVTPDGQNAVSGSADKTLKVWDLHSGQLIRTIEGHASFVNGVAITLDGQRVVSASADKTLKVWDLQSGQLIRTIEGHTNFVNAVVITPDGRSVISASADKTLKVWDLQSGQLIRTIEGHANFVNAVAVTPDGRTAVSASAGNTIRVWDLHSGQLLRSMVDRANFINAMIVTPDGHSAVSASADNSLKVWDLQSGQLLRTIEGHANSINAIAATPNGQNAVSASADKTVKVWDLHSGQLIRTIEAHVSFVNDVAITLDGRRLISASADHTLKIWDLDSGQLLAPFTADASVSTCTVAPDGMTIVAGDASGYLHFLRFEGFSPVAVPQSASLFRLLGRQSASPSAETEVNSRDFDVFMAHNDKDKAVVLAIADALKKRNIAPWIDVEQIPPGRWFQDFIQGAICEVKSAAICLGPHGLGKWEAVEFRAFISQCVDREIPVIPVLLPGVDKIPKRLIFLRELTWVKFKTLDDQDALSRLVWGIKGTQP